MSDLSRRVPADHGLSGLGLIMQLFGSVFGAVTALYGVMALIELSQMGRHGGGDSGMMLWILLIAGSGVTRSLLHRAAGADLIYGESPYQGVRHYLIASLVNAGAWLALLGGKLSAPASLLIPVLCLLLSWPIALTIALNMPGLRELSQRVPPGEDKGFEGASLLMLIFGLLGVIGTSLALYALWQSPSEVHSQGWFMLGVVALLVLIVRSVIHVNAAIQGLRETRLDVSVQAANRYADFGVIAAMIAGGAMLIAVMMINADVSALVGVTCLVWMLLAWPLTVRRFFGERQFADIMAGDDGAPHRRAPDLGLTTLGWFLFATSLVSLSFMLPAILLLPSRMGDMGGMGGMSTIMSIMSPGIDHSPWFGIGIAALELWAAIELIRMGELHRIAATAFGVVATAVNIYMYWPILTHLGSLSREGGLGSSTMVLASLAIQLIVPLTTLFAANRSVVPPATARFKPGAGAV